MEIVLILLSVIAINGLFFNKRKKLVESGGSLSTADIDFSEYKFSFPSHPIPFGEEQEAVIWTGKMDIELAYQKEEQEQYHKMSLARVVVRETRVLFLEGVDLETGEVISFRRRFITAKIKPSGKEWQSDREFLASLNIDVMQYDFRWFYREAKIKWEEELLTLWSSELPVETEFIYLSNIDQEWHTVDLSLIRQDTNDGQVYLTGTCRTIGEMRTFNASRIITKIVCARAKYSIEEFITDRLAAEESAA